MKFKKVCSLFSKIFAAHISGNKGFFLQEDYTSQFDIPGSTVHGQLVDFHYKRLFFPLSFTSFSDSIKLIGQAGG